VTSIGRQYMWFNCEGLQVGFISPRFNEKVRALLCVNDILLVTLKTDIVAWAHATELGRFRGHTKPPTVLCSVGAGLLVSASSDETLVWKFSNIGLAKKPRVDEGSGAVKATEAFFQDPEGSLSHDAGFGSCTAACHPPTYLHKVVLGGSGGGVALWNLRTLERVHTFRCPGASGIKSGAVTALKEAPNVLDLVAIGYASGRICVMNAREDEVVLELAQAQGSISSLSFRTGADAPAHLVSASPSGACVVWDLQKRRSHHVMEEAHAAAVVQAHFLPGEPLLVTSGRDNAIRMWIFDTADGLPRLLRSRIGCPGAARCMQFYGASGPSETQVIAAGVTGGSGSSSSGFVAKLSLIRPQLNQEFSQGNLKKIPGHARSSLIRRLPPVVDMAVCVVRHYDWPAVVTAHERMDAAVVWSAFNAVLAPAFLKPPLEADWSTVTAVAISACGNYCVIGMESGGMHRFNLQSQLHRGSFPLPPKPDASERSVKVKIKSSSKEPSPTAHLGRVCGISITVGGQVISVASHPEDCMLRVWKLATHEAVGVIELGASRSGNPSAMLLRVHGSLCAVSLDDGSCLVCDLHGMAVVRTFECGAPATAMAFSAEGRWLATALRGGALRVFDLPAARCVDSFVFPRPAISVAFSPSTAHLLTAHAKGQPIQVWANKFLFDPSLSAPLLQPEPAQPVNLDEPGDPGEDDELDAADAEEAVDADRLAEYAPKPSTIPLAADVLTLSDVPPAKWLATLHLDLVKERNKPKEPPKPLPNAPFFLPTAYDGVTPRFAAPMGEAEDKQGLEEAFQASGSHFLKGEAGLQATLPLQAMIREEKFDEALVFLREQTASGVHLALEELGPMATGSLAELSAGLDFFAHHLRKAHYADEVQAFLTIFLQAHGEELATDDDLRLKCSELSDLQERLWIPLDVQCQKVKCFLGTLTHTQSQW